MKNALALTLNRIALAVAATMLIIVTGPQPVLAQNVVVVVNGDPITSIDIEQRMKLEQLSTQKTPARQAVIDDLINDILKVKEAKRWGIELSDTEIDNAYASIGNRMHQNPDQLTQSLAKSGINAKVLKSRIRADMVWQQLVRGRFRESLQVQEDAVLGDNSAEPDAVTYDYTMRPILFIVTPGAPDTVLQARRKEAESLRARFKSCDEDLPLTRGMRDVAVRGQIVRNSGDLPPELRKIIDSVPVGELTAPEVTKLGIEMFAVCAKTQSKAETPAKRQAREKAYSERFDRHSKRYLNDLRRSALIEYK